LTRQNNTSLLLWRAGHNALVIPLGLTDHLALLGLSVSCGPIQPINPKLAVNVTYPSDETAVESDQQVGGNKGAAMVKWPKYFYPLILMKIGGWIKYH
jgi:FLVCR family feline leukemia virus subgroup C receptor-related protein